MVRRRAPHSYREAEKPDPDSICEKCGRLTVRVCEWCGICIDCHKGVKDNTEEF